MKILKILSSEFLPLGPDRDDNYIYFCYDNLTMYNGKVQYTDPYCIVDDYPTVDDGPVPNIYYIRKSDGQLCVYNKDIKIWFSIALIEDESQLEYLIKAGTTFLMKSGYRYIDKQTKSLDLPYLNGTYQLSVTTENPIKIDESTIIVYNPETGQFEIDGERYFDEFGRNPEILKYTGVETESAKTIIENDHISTEVKISANVGNILQSTATGLYATTGNLAKASELQELIERCRNQADTYAASLAEIEDALTHLDITLSDTTLNEMINDVIRRYFPNISSIINSYEELYEFTEDLVPELTDEIDRRILEAKSEIINAIDDTEDPWGYFIDTFKLIIEHISETRYSINVEFMVIDGKALAYTTLHNQYFYPGQDVDLGTEYTIFNNGDVVDLGIADRICVIYGNLIDNHIIVESCGYSDIINE